MEIENVIIAEINFFGWMILAQVVDIAIFSFIFTILGCIWLYRLITG